jgi:putative SOS response-associated peptidase YedK
MCGRFDIHSAIEIIARLFQLADVRFDIRPNYNVAPSQEILIVVSDGRMNRLVSSRWGLLPSWAKEKKTAYSMINARAETIGTGRSFRDAFRNQRCLVVADGFYEWLRKDKEKIPHYIRLRTRQPMAFAGLYNNWVSPEGEELRTSAIVTTRANELIKPLHDRMPAILRRDDFTKWLDPAGHDAGVLLPLLSPCPAGELEVYRVTPKVNSVRYNRPDAMEPVL